MIHVNRLPTLVRQHIAAFRALLAFTVLCGIIYPVIMVGVAQVAFKNQADGSLVVKASCQAEGEEGETPGQFTISKSPKNAKKLVIADEGGNVMGEVSRCK